MNHDILGLLFVLLFLGGMLFYWLLGRKNGDYPLRPIDTFIRLKRAMDLSVEDGSRLHLSLGRGSISTLESAASLIGLTVLERITRLVSGGDRPPVVTSGDGALSLLSRDTLKAAYVAIDDEGRYDPHAGRLSGVTPFSYVGGAVAMLYNEQVSSNVLIGHYGEEIALLTEAAERNGCMVLAGTDSLSGQAVLYATAPGALIGEELYAAPAYLKAGPIYVASLRTQDLLRWALVIVMLLGALAKLMGIW